MLVTKSQRIHEILLRNLMGSTFDAYDRIGSAADDNFNITLFLLAVCWIGNKLAVHTADTHRSHGTGKGDIRNT